MFKGIYTKLIKFIYQKKLQFKILTKETFEIFCIIRDWLSDISRDSREIKIVMGKIIPNLLDIIGKTFSEPNLDIIH